MERTPTDGRTPCRSPHRRTRFQQDPRITGPSAHDADFRNSGYSRGHLVPAADVAYSDQALRESFYLTNAAVRRLAADAVYVFSGPIFEGQDTVIGAGRVAVPSHLFKALLVEKDGQRTMYAAIIPNAVFASLEPIDHYLTSVQEVQRRTGLDFFPLLEHNEQLALESVQSSLPD